MALGQISQNRTAFKHGQRTAFGTMINNGGDFVVGRDGQKARRELFVAPQVDGDGVVREAQLFQQDRYLAAVRRAPSVKRNPVKLLTSLLCDTVLLLKGVPWAIDLM
jgi:hypothetical protein